jgi:hypothetical protein
MEAEMSEAAIRLSESVNGGSQPESSPAIGDLDNVSLSASADKYLVDMRHFARLSNELTVFLSELSEKIRSSAEQLKMIEQAVELKTEEFRRLHGIEIATVTLERILEDQRSAKEQFEAGMASQRSLWEEEKARRSQEQKEYIETLSFQRKCEEEESRRQRAAEQAKAKQELTEELQSIQKKHQANQEAFEKDFLERELLLKQKETEWMRLVQELEQFMADLGKRTRSK